MENRQEFSIENLYCGKTTEDYKPAYAKHTTFVRESKYKLYFEKINDKYKELLTGTEITSVIDDITEARVGVLSIINPQKVEKKKFSKLQLREGKINQVGSVRLYKTQDVIQRQENKNRIKVKVLTFNKVA